MLVCLRFFLILLLLRSLNSSVYSSYQDSLDASSSCVFPTMASVNIPPAQRGGEEYKLILPENEDREHVTYFLNNGLQVLIFLKFLISAQKNRSLLFFFFFNCALSPSDLMFTFDPKVVIQLLALLFNFLNALVFFTFILFT